MRIVFIGAGNLATNLAPALAHRGHEIVQVYSRTLHSAQLLGEQLQCSYTTTVCDIIVDAELYVFCVKDSALESLVSNIASKCKNTLFVHTAGAVPMDIFAQYTNRFGVIYPLQTFSKTRLIDFSVIPIFIEASSPKELLLLQQLAHSLSHNVHQLSSDKRNYLHLSAVFACNFANHCYAMAQRVLNKQGVPFEIMLPLINETTAKIHALSPSEAQTGPAVRYDQNIINKHLALLEEWPELKQVYQLMSESIYRNTNKTENT